MTLWPSFGGLLIKKISTIKIASRKELEFVKAKTAKAEAKYILDPTLDNQLDWLSSQRR